MDDSSLDTSGEYSSSQVSNITNSGGSQTRKGHGFKKDDWLKDYFTHDFVDGKRVVICKACKKCYSNRSHERMRSHLSSGCPGLDFDETVMFETDLDMTEKDITNQFVKSLVAGNWSFRSVETKEFKLFIKMLNKNWTIPPRRAISAIHIPRLSQQLMKDFMQDLRSHQTTMSITVMFDHWEDANHRSFLGIIATLGDGRRFLLDIRDVSLRSHAAPVTVEELISVLESVPKKSINSIVSDSASPCTKARKDIIKEDGFQHIIQHRCLAHLMNLVGSKITNKGGDVAAMVKKASKATAIVSNSVFWINYVRSLHMNRPQSACPVRWYSTITMIEALIDLESVILEQMIPELRKLKEFSKAEIFETLDWQQMREIYDVLKPLCECIGQVERHDISLGEGIKCILDFAKHLFDDCNVGEGSRLSAAKVAAREAFLDYFNPKYLGRDEFALFIAAYAMDRRYKLDYLTDAALDRCFEALALIILRKGRATLDQVMRSLKLEFDYYKAFACGFGETSENQIQWWSERTDCSLLSGVGLRIAYLKASSANIERTFSSLKFIQGDYRLSLSRETLLHTARVRISLTDTCSNVRELIEEIETNCTIQDIEDLSIEQSDDSSESVSNITQPESSNWLEYLSRETKENFQSFFKYFNFSLIKEVNSQQQTQHLTDEQIYDCIEKTLHPETYETVIYDSAAEMQILDEEMSSM